MCHLLVVRCIGLYVARFLGQGANLVLDSFLDDIKSAIFALGRFHRAHDVIEVLLFQLVHELLGGVLVVLFEGSGQLQDRGLDVFVLIGGGHQAIAERQDHAQREHTCQPHRVSPVCKRMKRPRWDYAHLPDALVQVGNRTGFLS